MSCRHRAQWGGLTPLWCLSTPQVFIDPHWFSQQYIATPLWFYHKSSTDHACSMHHTSCIVHHAAYMREMRKPLNKTLAPPSAKKETRCPLARSARNTITAGAATASAAAATTTASVQNAERASQATTTMALSIRQSQAPSPSTIKQCNLYATEYIQSSGDGSIGRAEL